MQLQKKISWGLLALIMALAVGPFLCNAQVTIAAVDGGLSIQSATEQVDGTTVTVATGALDSVAAKNRIFDSAISTYDRIAELENELRLLEKQGNELRTLYSTLDTSGYLARVAKLYGESLAGDYRFQMGVGNNKTVSNATIRTTPAGVVQMKVGTDPYRVLTVQSSRRLRAKILDGKDVFDVWILQISKGLWLGEVNGKRITLKRK